MSDPARRLFFALWPDDEVRHALLHWQTANLGSDVLWQHRADLHMTLHFLGAVEPDRITPLRRLAADAAGNAFELLLDRIGHWPGPRVLWAAPADTPPPLAALHRRLAVGLEGLGMPVEARRFRPHVTLARKVAGLPELPPLAPLSWTVTELALVESRPGAAPHYRPLARWPLASSTPPG